jgi:hypothetical protein
MTQSDAAAPIPGVLEVRRIAALDDPVVRNLQITQCYHALSQAMAALTGPGANWCSMATWASRQAGQSIRREDLRRTFDRLLSGSDDVAAGAQQMGVEAAGLAGSQHLEVVAALGAAPEQDLAGAVEALRAALSPAEAFRRTADAVARGNRKVFEEIGLEFARFLATFEDGLPDPAKLDVFLEGLRPGAPPDGQHYLRRAFTHYHRALGVADFADRVQLLLLANLEIGFHEQTRLQPEIIEAMNAPVVDSRVLRRRLLEELFPRPDSGWRKWLAGLGDLAGPLLASRDRLADEARRIGRLAISEHMMVLEMPDGRKLRLGQDLAIAFPEPLRTVTDPELAALLARIDPTAGSTRETGAEDWGDLPDRMHFIADLFRGYHLEAALFRQPFTEEQAVEILAGRRPEGRL